MATAVLALGVTGAWADRDISSTDLVITGGTATYSGTGKTVTVALADNARTEDCAAGTPSYKSGDDDVASPTDAGTYVVTVALTGCANDDNNGALSSATGLIIGKKTPVLTGVNADIEVTPVLSDVILYLESPALEAFVVTVAPKSPMTKMGTPTIRYRAGNTGTTYSTTPVKTAGTHGVYLALTAGDNFALAAETQIGTYTVMKDVSGNKLGGANPATAAVFSWDDFDTSVTYGKGFSIPRPKAVSNGTDNGHLRYLGLRIKSTGAAAATVWDTLPKVAGTADAWVTGGSYAFANASGNVFKDNTLKTLNAGTYDIFAICSTTTSASGSTLKFWDEFKIGSVTVERKEATDAMISVTGNYTYKGVVQNPIRWVVKDGDRTVTDQFTEKNTVATNAGTDALIMVEGNADGNYYGLIAANFTIAKAQVSIDKSESVVADKAYDGTLIGNPDDITLEFSGLVNSEELVDGADYTISDVLYASSNANSSGVSVSFTVTWDTAGSVAKNYALKDAARVTLNYAGKIVATAPTSETVGKLYNFTIPTDHYFTGRAKGIGAVTFKPGVNNGTAKDTVKYRYTTGGLLKTAAGADIPLTDDVYKLGGGDCAKVGDERTDVDGCYVDSVLAPAYPGTYGVYLYYTTGNNFGSAGSVQLSDAYQIKAHVKPAFTPALTVEDGLNAGGGLVGNPTRVGNQVTLRVNASSPNGDTLIYTWRTFPSAESDAVEAAVDAKEGLISGATSATYKFQPTSTGTLYIGVMVTNGKKVGTPNIQAPDSILVGPVAVVVNEPAAPLPRTAYLKFADDYEPTYTGSGITPDASIVTVVVIKSEDEDTTHVALEMENFELEYSNNVNVGNAAKVTAMAFGMSEYSGSVSGTFKISKADPARGDLDWYDGRVYSANSLGAAVVPYSDEEVKKTGMGKITVYYDGDTTIPVNVGRYPLSVDVEGGANYNAATDISLGVFVITKKTVRKSDFDTTSYSLNPQRYTGSPLSIGNPTLLASAGTGYGAITVFYSGDDELQSDLGTYTVTVRVDEGPNFKDTTIVLGTFNIYDPTSVAEIAKEVPQPGDGKQVVVIAPVKPLSAVLTVGPSPVKSGEVVKFFYSGKPATGKLYVYGSTGSLVKKLSVSSATGEVASLKLTGVPAGTYIVKGALKSDGKVEKVSALFSVR
jgi:hypothetical protein